MLHDWDFYLAEVSALIDRDQALRTMQAALDRMAHLEYSLPEPLQKLQWMRNYRTTAPYDALRGATRALSGLEETLNIEPISVMKALHEAGLDDDSLKARGIANAWEQALKWNMRKASTRAATYRSDLVWSAVNYDEICVQVVHLPTQIAAHSKLGKSSNRYKAALRHGPFAVLIRNPQTVHTRYSDFMAEAVVSITVQTPRQIVEMWGDAAQAVQALIDIEKAEEYYLLIDYTDLEGRCVWAVPGDDESEVAKYEPDSDSFIEILAPTKLDYPFMPWVCVVGGTALDPSPEHRRLPLLYPIYRSELWLNANMVGSLSASMAVATAAQPRLHRSGPDPSSVEIDYTTPGATVDTTPGHDVKPLPTEGLDPAMAALFDRHLGEIDRATVSKVLVTADVSPGETFSGYNLRVKTAIGSLMPYKGLAERALEGIYTTMLYWGHYTGTDISGYGVSADDKGKKYSIPSEDVDPDCLYLAAGLTADVPIDRQQQVAVAVQMRQMLGMSDRTIYTWMGVADPEKEMADSAKDMWRKAMVQGYAQRIQMEDSGQLQQMAQQMAQQMMEQQMQAQQEQQQQGQDPNAMGGYGQEANVATGTPGLGPEAQGPMFDPSQGGIPAAQVNPVGATREGQTGMDAMGLGV